MSRKLAEIEAEALQLGARARASLARKLFESLGRPAESAHERAWYDEAERRMRAFQEGRIDTILAREVLRRTRSEIRRKPRSG
jgi:hypothetical protein